MATTVGSEEILNLAAASKSPKKSVLFETSFAERLSENSALGKFTMRYGSAFTRVRAGAEETYFRYSSPSPLPDGLEVVATPCCDCLIVRTLLANSFL